MTAPAPAHRRWRGPGVLAVSMALALALTAACTSRSAGQGDSSTTSPTGTQSSTNSTTPPPSSSTTPPASPTTATPPPSTTAAALSCGQRLATAMTPAQRAGQLLMVGLFKGSSPTALAAQIKAQHLGGVLYVGGWTTGRPAVAAVSTQLQRAGSGSLLIAADQEGGQVQQLKGAGFSRIPSARTQATLGVAAEQRDVRTWAAQLKAAGVNVDLAPVADTVPASLGSANAPIGHYQRDFAPGDPTTNGRYAAAFVRGARAAGIAPTLKHFPGLGRITGNTDVSSTGITDSTTGPHDPYLEPFRAGIAAGAPMVMVSSARYTRLDPDNPAMFSHAVITSLLRDDLGFRGVVITDDVGAVKALSGVPVGERATRFISAGGDIVLTVKASQAPAMLAAIAAERAKSPAFAAQVDAAAARVLTLKAALGLVRCT